MIEKLIKIINDTKNEWTLGVDPYGFRLFELKHHIRITQLSGTYSSYCVCISGTTVIIYTDNFSHPGFKNTIQKRQY